MQYWGETPVSESSGPTIAPPTEDHAPDGDVSNVVLDSADAILRCVEKVDRDHDIPYLAGYSNDGLTIYIDRHMPHTFDYKGRAIEVDRYLILHEKVEKALIDQLGLHYTYAHEIATCAEAAAVSAAGIDWMEYSCFMQHYIDEMSCKPLSQVPADLDWTPYRDECDTELMERMKKAVEIVGIKKGSFYQMKFMIFRNLFVSLVSRKKITLRASDRTY
jgi:hypothetical protein